MSITFTNGPFKKPETQDPSKKPPQQDPSKQREKERLQKQQQQIQKKLEQMKTSVADKIKNLALIIAADPNVFRLFRQIRPLLSKMNIANIANASKTELVPGRTRKKDSLYKITLQRNAQITEDIIKRIKRQGDNFESMQWSAKALELYLWYLYEAQIETTPGTPAAPGTPGAPGTLTV